MPTTTPHADVPDAAIERAAAIFRAAGDVARLRLLTRLADGEMCVTALARRAGESLSTVSQRLRLLRTERLVRRRRDGRRVYYALADEHVATLIASVVAHVCEATAVEDPPR